MLRVYYHPSIAAFNTDPGFGHNTSVDTSVTTGTEIGDGYSNLANAVQAVGGYNKHATGIVSVVDMTSAKVIWQRELDFIGLK